MARKKKQDLAKEKAAKQKKIAIGGAVVLVALLAFEVPKTMKMMSHPSASAPPPATTTAPTAATPTPSLPTDPNAIAAPTIGGAVDAAAPTTTAGDLVSAVPLSADAGQLQTFERFASKDPFAAQVSTGGSKPAAVKPVAGTGTATAAPPAGGTSTTPAPTPPPSSSPAPTSAVISLNGELMSVQVQAVFPTSGTTFGRVGSIFKLESLTGTSAKIAIVDGRYADGAKAIPLKLRTPVTLQNTADGTKYTLILEPPDTPVTPASSASSAPPAGGTTTTPQAVVPAPTGNGG